MNVLQEVTKFIGWLSGALAGIGAMLYGFGYLVVLSHHYVLGVGPFLFYSHHYYIQRGWRFVLDVVTFRHDLVFAAVMLALVAAGFAVLLRLLWFKLVSGKSTFAHLRARVRRARLRLPWLERNVALYVSLILVLLFYSYERLLYCHYALEVTGLLFYDTAAVEEAKGVGRALLRHDTDALEEHFACVLLATVIATTLLLLARRATRRWRWHTLAVSPFLLVALIYLMMLPMVYGALMLRLEYHPVELTLRERNISLSDGRDHFLLTATDRAFIVWDSGTQKVLWIPRDEVRELKLLQKKELSLAPDPGGDE